MRQIRRAEAECISTGPAAYRSRGNHAKVLIETIVRALVDNPEQVKVSEIEGGMISIIELRAAKPDLEKMIGKQGCYANAMRTILSAVSTKLGKPAILKIIG
jgi:uncharacterized protein